MIIFLDFDGVISTNRAWMAQKHIDDFYLRWLDPVACAMLRELCEQFNLTLVVSSTWRKFGFNHVFVSLAAHGLAKYLHNDWCTKDLWESSDSRYSRPEELRDWLNRNGNPDYLILDDDSFAWSARQRERWIKTSTLNGFSTEDMEDCINRLEAATGVKYKP